MIDPYEAAGLRRNPFVVDEREIAGEVWLDRGWSEARVRTGTLVQFLGEKGSGKSSHLHHWRAQLGGPCRYVAPGRDRWRPPPVVDPVVFWDEANRIPTPILAASLRAVAARRGMVVAGTHRDLSREAHRAGLEVTTVILDGITDFEIEQWASVRIGAAAIDERRARRVLGSVPVDAARPSPTTTWRDIGDHLHRWAALRVARHATAHVDEGTVAFHT